MNIWNRFKYEERGSICVGGDLEIDGTTGLLQVSNPPDVRVSRTVNQPIPSGVETTILFDAEVFDNDNMHDNAVLNNRITFQTNGVYAMMFNVQFPGGVDFYTGLYAYIIKNGAYFLCLDVLPGWASNGSPTLRLSTIDGMITGDFIEVRVLQTNTDLVSRNVQVVSNFTPELAAGRVSRGNT